MAGCRQGEVLRTAANTTARTVTADPNGRPVKSQRRWPLGVELRLVRPVGHKLWRSAIGAQNFPDFAIDSHSVLGRFVDQVEPLAVIVVELRLSQKIRSLHDGFEGITEIVCQGTQFANRLALQLSCSLPLRVGPPSSLLPLH